MVTVPWLTPYCLARATSDGSLLCCGRLYDMPCWAVLQSDTTVIDQSVLTCQSLLSTYVMDRKGVSSERR